MTKNLYTLNNNAFIYNIEVTNVSQHLYTKSTFQKFLMFGPLVIFLEMDQTKNFRLYRKTRELD